MTSSCSIARHLIMPVQVSQVLEDILVAGTQMRLVENWEWEGGLPASPWMPSRDLS